MNEGQDPPERRTQRQRPPPRPKRPPPPPGVERRTEHWPPRKEDGPPRRPPPRDRRTRAQRPGRSTRSEAQRGPQPDSSGRIRAFLSAVVPCGYRALTSDYIQIGRDVSNELVLPHDSVSKSHAVAADDDGAVVLTDLQSTNGTTVNGSPLDTPRALKDGDKISIGMFELVYREFDDAESLREAAWGIGRGGTKKFDFITVAFDAAERGVEFAGAALVQFSYLLVLRRKAGRLRVKGEDAAGEVEFQEGAIVAARSGGQRGAAAVETLLAAERGWYKFDPVRGGGALRDPIVDADELLADLAYRIG